MLSFVEWNNAVVEQHVSVSHSESGDVVSNKQDNWQFRFHHVMHNAGQETVFDTLAAPIVSQATQGINGTGQTFPAFNTIAHNHFDTVGIYTKQVGVL